ncbi:MAG: hypothetical protein OEW69_10155, partial [Nitrospirota bacterium]|nr:hypothetical protein [Nitrospirota bacterium]
MKFWQKLLGKKEDMTTESEENGKKQRFKKKYKSFQELLSSNNTVLEAMADMEEKLSGEFLFDRHYIDQYIITIANGVKNIIDNLNKISHDKYSALYERFNDINSKIENLLTRKSEIPESSYTISFEKITGEMADRLGGKTANLGEIKNRLNMP